MFKIWVGGGGTQRTCKLCTCKGFITIRSRENECIRFKNVSTLVFYNVDVAYTVHVVALGSRRTNTQWELPSITYTIR